MCLIGVFIKTLINTNPKSPKNLRSEKNLIPNPPMISDKTFLLKFHK